MNLLFLLKENHSFPSNFLFLLKENKKITISDKFAYYCYNNSNHIIEYENHDFLTLFFD